MSWSLLNKVLKMTTICVDTLSGSLHNILGDAPDGWTSIGGSELLHALDEFLYILWLLTVHLLLHFSPKVNVQRIQIGRVRWLTDSSTATDNTPFELLEKKLLGCIGAVRRGSILHPPVVSSRSFAS